MRSGNLIFRNLRYYRWPYLAVLAGVMVSTAVLTGALLVGDSVRSSLGKLTELRLGATSWALQSDDRFFRSALATDMSAELNHPVVPLLQLPGIGINSLTGNRLQGIQVVGVDSSFSSIWDGSVIIPGEDEVVISENLGAKLDLHVGDPLLIRLPKAGKAPQNAPFVAEEAPSVSLRLTVAAIAGEKEMGRFSLKSNQRAPFNAFVSLSQLAARINIPGSANMLLAPLTEDGQLTVDQLDKSFQNAWRMPDAGFRITRLEKGTGYQIVTERIFFDNQMAEAIRKNLPDSRRIFTYLANTFSFNGRETPYSFVTAVDSGLLPVRILPGEILVTDWLAEDLEIKAGDSLTISYFVMGPLRRLREEQAGFRVAGIIPLTSIPDGEIMMPDFPGMSDAGQCSDWETGSPIDLDRIRDKDEAYWNSYRGTPKAFISFADGQKLWDNPFGTVTAFRYVAETTKGNPPPASANMFTPIGTPVLLPRSLDSTLMAGLDPAWYRFEFQPVRQQGQLAAANSTDFGELFLSLSFFLIASSLLLTALLFSLHALTRISEIGILSGLGFRKGLITRMLFSEALVVTIPGVILGALAGILYNKLILTGLNTFWQDAVRTSMLEMEVSVGTLLTGAGMGFILAISVLFLTLRRQLRQTIALRVKGRETPLQKRGKRRKVIWVVVGIAFTLLSFLLIGTLLISHATTDAGLFLSAGGLMIAGAVILVHAYLTWQSERKATGRTGLFMTVLKLGSRKRSRSIAAITLLALGTFTVIITGANRKTFYGAERDRQSGTGGYLLWTETTMPLLYDLNTSAGRSYFALEDEPLLEDLHFVQLHRLSGNDASCLNLNQVQQPMMLGIPGMEFDTLGAFRMVSLLPGVDPQHPWRTLNHELSPGVIPAFADQTVITWGLQKKVGDTLLYLDEQGKEIRVKLMGGLDNSIFQGHILVSDSLLKSRFPSISGSLIMLVDGPFEDRHEVAARLEELFTDYGMMAIPASDRLAEFNSVENTYLSVFMLLGALGVLIGTIGFGIIIWRNNLERSGEIALYLAIGFRRNIIRSILITEYLLILFVGMTLGILGAVAGILPSMISPAYQMPGGFLLLLLGVIWISGAVWIIMPVHRLFTNEQTHSLQAE